VSNENLLTESYTYLRNDDPTDSPNFVILRCAVVVGKTFPAIGPMYRITSPPSGYDSVSATKGVTLGRGRRPVSNDETAVFTKAAILPVQVIVLRDARSSRQFVSPHSTYTTKLINVRDADWNKYPEAIRDTRQGDVLWTDGNDGYKFASAPNIRAYKVVRRSGNVVTGNVIAEGYAAANPFYFVFG